MTLEAAETAMEVYQRALQKHARTTPSTIAIRKDIYVADNASEAEQTRREVIAQGYRGFDTQALIIGEPSEVAEQFVELEKLGYTDIIIRNLNPDPALAVSSTQRLAAVKSLINSR